MPRWLVPVALAALAVAARPCRGTAQDVPAPTPPPADTTRAPGDTVKAPAVTVADTLTPLPGDSVKARARPRPLVAALEGIGISILTNRIDYWARKQEWANVSPSSWSRNVRLGWTWDTDHFQENQFAHPYSGGMFFNAGRDNGLTFWEAAPLAFLGSAEWEYFGETERPSLNDIYNTTFGGIIVGEMGHRLADLVRNNEQHGLGRVLREIAALPFDPVGGLNRILRGGFTRVGPNPDDRHPDAFGMEVQAGARLSADSGSLTHSSLSGTVLVDISYGNAFAKPFAHPFDVFHVRLQVSQPGSINLMNARGRLYSVELSDTTAAIRTAVTVVQQYEFRSNPAYKFGGQSVGLGLVSGYAVGAGIDLRTEVYGEALLLAAVDAPGTSVAGTGLTGTGLGVRTYDYGPGAGLDVSMSLMVRGTQVLAIGYRWAFVHSVSGSPNNHFLQFASIEAGLPISRNFGVGAFAGFYQRRSTYKTSPVETRRFPELRAYITWRNNHGLRLRRTQ